MEKIVDLLLGSFDFGYMFSVNVLTYIIIKIVDKFNGRKKVKVWQKRTIAVLCGIIIGGIITIINGFSNILLYSFILSLVTWDTVFKPIIKRISSIDYKK